MSAEEIPAGDKPVNKRRGLIEQFHDEYEAAFADVVVSSEHTGTEGWQKLYTTARAEERTLILGACKSLERLSQDMQVVGPTEDGEKGVADVKKQMTAIRERRDAFDLHTVAPVKAPVEACERIIERYRAAARRQEQEAPLHDVGLEHLMNDAISRTPKAAWDEDSGRVEIAKP